MNQPVTTGYEERLWAPWWWWVLALLVAAVLVAPFAWSGQGPLGWLVFVGALLATGLGLWWLSRVRVAVVDGELRVDDARLPVRYVTDVIPLTDEDRRELLGASADPLAFVVQRPWLPGAVQVVLADPSDPTPYWLISSRHPERLAAALGHPAPEG